MTGTSTRNKAARHRASPRPKIALLYFVKYPEPGMVKTRLAKSIGPIKAAQLYRRLAETNYQVILEEKILDRIIVYDPPEKEKDIKKWLAGARTYLPQEGQGLGERLAAAFGWAFAQGYERVMALGSDLLGLPYQNLFDGIASLQKTNVVIGPATDGGYYLIGMDQFYAGLFQDIPWSTPQVFAETLRRIKSQGLSFYQLGSLDDLDDISSLHRAKHEMGKGVYHEPF